MMRDRVAYGACVAAFAGLGATGFLGWWALGGLRGWGLLIHVAISPALLLGLPVLALLWAERCRFGGSAAGCVQPGQKLAFWAVLVLGFVSAGSMVVAMMPVFGHARQALLYDLHRYSALALLVVVVAHWLLLALSKGKASKVNRA